MFKFNLLIIFKKRLFILFNHIHIKMKINGIGGEYIGIGAHVDIETSKTFNFIKIGTSGDCNKRCHQQRLTFIGHVSVRSKSKNYYYKFENEFLSFTRTILNHTRFLDDRPPAGHTECFGKFFNTKEALIYAIKIFNEYNPEKYKRFHNDVMKVEKFINPTIKIDKLMTYDKIKMIEAHFRLKSGKDIEWLVSNFS